MLKRLDFGCGSGGFEQIDYKECRLRSWLALHDGENSWGIDADERSIQKAALRINHGTHLLQMNGEKLTFPDNYFDEVHVWGVLHHMLNYEKGLSEIHRVLKPYGQLILTESVDNDIMFRLARRVFDRWQNDDVSNLFDSRKLDNALRKHFIVETREYHWRFLPSDFLRQYNLEPRISLILNEWVSEIFNLVGLGERTCCHYVVKAVNYKKR